MSHYERVIIGAGLSGLSLLDRWLDAGVLPPGLKVAIIDSQIDSVRAKTFAYWRLKSDQEIRFNKLVDYRWERFRVTRPSDRGDQSRPSMSFGDYVYEKISGERFYHYVRDRMAADDRFIWVQDRVVEVLEGNSCLKLKLASGEELSTHELWSSAVTDVKPKLIQHFLGYEIETDFDAFDPEVVDLMDFRVAQKGETRFIYILPFSRRNALVEFTLFSEQILTDAEYQSELQSYLARQLGLTDYRILRTEKGVIPMVLDMVPRFAATGGGSPIYPIGAAAGQIKASTGYSFRRNQKSLSSLSSSTLRYYPQCQWRFAVYDALLLEIIRSDGTRMSQIFPQLFETNNAQTIFKFLDEETHFLEEIKIFYSLPWCPFLKNFLVLFPFPVGLLLTLMIFPYGHLMVPILGLLFLGITHGSLDHQFNPVPRGKTWVFFLKYVLWMISYLVLWWIALDCAPKTGRLTA
jgi:lycopene beta-cyclase